MNPLIWKATMATAAVLAAAFAPAAFAAADFVQLDIPFSFYAGDQILPAGVYRIDVHVSRNWVALRRLDGSAGGHLLGYVNHRPGTPRSHGFATFKQYGDTFFLRQVATAGRTVTHDLPASNREREIAKARSAKVVAMVQIPAR